MRKFAKIKIIVITLGIFLVFSIIINVDIKYNDEYINGNEHKLKNAGHWEIGPIEIDDDDPTKNWSLIEATYDWCSGSGTWNDPFKIENTTINGLSTGSCIEIHSGIIGTRYYACKSGSSH